MPRVAPLTLTIACASVLVLVACSEAGPAPAPAPSGEVYLRVKVTVDGTAAGESAWLAPGVGAERIAASVLTREAHNDALWKAPVLRRTQRRCTDPPTMAARITMTTSMIEQRN